MAHETELTGPDFASGIAMSDLSENTPLLGHAHGKPVVLIRQGAEVRALGTTCSHYGGPLAEGLVVGATVRCPWHHACFMDPPDGRSARHNRLDSLRANWPMVWPAPRRALIGQRDRPGVRQPIAVDSPEIGTDLHQLPGR